MNFMHARTPQLGVRTNKDETLVRLGPLDLELRQESPLIRSESSGTRSGRVDHQPVVGDCRLRLAPHIVGPVQADFLRNDVEERVKSWMNSQPPRKRILADLGRTHRRSIGLGSDFRNSNTPAFTSEPKKDMDFSLSIMGPRRSSSSPDVLNTSWT
jgi:hypothetical protein